MNRIDNSSICCSGILFVSKQLLAATSLLLLLQAATQAGQSNSLMDISLDGLLLASSNRDSGTVTIVDLESNKVLREVKVGKKPEGVSFLGDSHTLGVAVYEDDKIVFLDADSGTINNTTEVFDEPYGVVSSKDGSRIYVTIEYPGKVLELDASDGRILRQFSAGKFPRGIGVARDGGSVYVCEYLTTTVHQIDLKSGRIVDAWKGASEDNLVRQIAMHPKRDKAYFGNIRSKVTAHHGSGSIFPYVTILDLFESDERRRKKIPMDAFEGTRVTANPWEVAVSPDGRRFYAVFSGTDDMFACTTINDDYREIKLTHHVQLGRNPRAARVSPDNERLYVYNALDFEVVVYDAIRLTKLATIPVTKNPLSEEVLLGKVLFYSAQMPMSSRRWISCSSCHPDGQPDGRTWHNPEGLRNTPTMRGLAWTHPQHWSADRDETQDFEHTIRGLLMQGRGLAKGKINKPLGKSNKGLSASLDALAAYTNSHGFSFSPYAKAGLSESAQQGRALFFSKKTRCAECHTGPYFADSQSGRPGKVHDVGTGQDDPSETIGPKYDTPTLLGLYRTAPYLHHGKAATLLDVLTTQNKGDRHGKTSHLSDAQRNDLVEFLKALPYEDPEPAAVAEGIVPVRN